jgi:hypothetical protein
MVSWVCCSLRTIVSITVLLKCLIIRITLSSLLIIKMTFENQILTFNFISRFLLFLGSNGLFYITIVRGKEELIINIGNCLGLRFTRFIILLIEIIQAVYDPILQNIFHIRNKGVWLLGVLSILFDPKIFRGWFIIISEYR